MISRRIIITSILLSLLLVPWVGIGFDNSNPTIIIAEESVITEPDRVTQLAIEDTELPRIEPNGNLLEGPGFENGNYSYFGNTMPGDWSGLAFLDRKHWYATSPSFGVASGGLRARSTGWGAEVTARWYQSLQAPLENISLSLQWWLESNSDPATSHNMYRVHLLFSNSRSIYYYLSGYMSTHTNGSTTTAYLINGAAQTWHLLQRNVTADYIATGNMPYSPTYSLTQIRIEIYCRVPTISYTEGYVDNVAIMNGTSVQIGASIKNGDFEATTDWLTLQNSTQGMVDLADHAAEGSKSLNLTFVSDGTPGGVAVRQWLNTRLTASSTHWLSWQYYAHHDDYVGSNLMTSVQVSCRNATDTFTINYVIESRLGMLPSNTSTALWFDLGVVFMGWIQEDHNLWTEASEYFATDEIWATQIAIRIDSDGYTGDQRYEMLWDDVQFEGAYMEDPGFEEQGEVGDYVRSSLSDSAFFKVTNTSYRGEKAANFTIEEWIGSHSANMYLRDFPAEGATFIDIMWQLHRYTPATGTHVRVHVRVDDLYSIYYYLGAYGPEFGANTTYEAHLNTSDVNTVGSWFRFQCNVQEAFQSVFQYTFDYVDYSEIEIDYGGDSNFTLLLDDVYIYTDVAPPIIMDVDSGLSEATGDPHPVTIEVDEWPGTPAGTLHYRYQRQDEAVYTDWMQLGLTMVPDDPVQLVANIPAYDDLDELLTPVWPLECAFYLVVDDSLGNSVTDDNEGDYYTYLLLDTTGPSISTSLEANATYMGTIAYSITASDPHSGVVAIDAFVDGAYVESTTGTSINGEWITNQWPDGEHNWTIRSWDNDDNYAEITFTVTIRNATFPVVPVLVAAVAGVAALVVVVMYWQLRIKPKKS